MLGPTHYLCVCGQPAVSAIQTIAVSDVCLMRIVRILISSAIGPRRVTWGAAMAKLRRAALALLVLLIRRSIAIVVRLKEKIITENKYLLWK